ncbi:MULTISPECIES: MerR family transcriptional regulator [unclassified Roseovarius]|uniref:MerR family transcriptional regulator n=1 Tax=unclassified Roseovarius TaxID=2614913 RepID=UPI00273ECBDF|nr:MULTISPECIES: MerR family transcriptional regulator [unclassified Roseovarius]
MAKSADAFRTISEVADWLDTPAHVLRFWESKFAQVKPVKRAGGRRYYRPSDMLLLGGIKKLLHSDGMTIKGVQKLLREHGVKHVAGHSQPLDDITAAEDKAVTVEAEAPPLEQPETEPVLDATPQEAPPAEPEAPEAPTDPAPVADDATDDPPPVMPSFSHRPVTEDAPAETSEEVQEEEPDTPPPAPKPSVVDTPDDPADDVRADPGILAQMGTLKAPVSGEMADRLADVLDRLRQTGGGNGTGQDG